MDGSWKLGRRSGSSGKGWSPRLSDHGERQPFLSFSFPFITRSLFLLVSRRQKLISTTLSPHLIFISQDFRSSDGLYNLVKARYPSTFVTGKDLFSSSLFRSPDSTSLFYSFIAELKLAVSAAEPSATHRFIKKLDDKGKLMRSYTQNIDGMEKRVGMKCSSSPDEPAGEEDVSSRASTPALVAGPSSSQGSSFSSSEASSSSQPFSSQGSTSSQASSFPSSSQESYAPISRRSASVVSSASSGGGGVTMDKKLTKNIQLHGDIHRVRCMVCSASYEFTEEYVEMFREGEAPECPACEERSESFVSRLFSIRRLRGFLSCHATRA